LIPQQFYKTASLFFLILKYYILFSHNIVVEGDDKSAIYDLQNNRIIPIPTVFVPILNEFRTLKQDDIIKKYSPDKPEIILSYIKYLEKHDLGFYTDNPELFPELNRQWYLPFRLQSALVEIDNFNQQTFEIFSQIQECECQFLELRIEIHKLNLFFLSQLPDIIENSTIRSYSLIAPYRSKPDENELLDFIHKHPKLNMLIFTESPEERSEIRNHRKIYFITQKLDDPILTQNTEIHILNTKYFAEALIHNPFFNKKVYIDKAGNIFNDPQTMKCFGNINTTSLSKIISSSDFQSLWNYRVDESVAMKKKAYRYTCVFNQIN
jgi:SPASM domain peptide maturase of grasp-with-spasm system